MHHFGHIGQFTDNVVTTYRVQRLKALLNELSLKRGNKCVSSQCDRFSPFTLADDPISDLVTHQFIKLNNILFGAK
ncbi:MAG: hypothetical protein QOI11_1592 [Candidatus Eremiobacteraeota bacterium]|nr:hypothetical protein [Candidatus Eremiobacteraeota bacterium]